MKKTEKIELRVDHEEKERLSAIAEGRGQTVSDVVRDALAGDLGVARATYPKWPGWSAVVAGLIGTAALVLALGPAPDRPETEIVYPKTVQVNAEVRTQSEVDGTVRYQDISFEMLADHAEDRNFELDAGDGTVLRVAIQTRPGEEGLLLHIDAKSCLVVEDSCDMKPMPTVAVQLRPARSSRAETSATLGSNTEVEINFLTSTLRLGPPKAADS